MVAEIWNSYGTKVLLRIILSSILWVFLWRWRPGKPSLVWLNVGGLHLSASTVVPVRWSVRSSLRRSHRMRAKLSWGSTPVRRAGRLTSCLDSRVNISVLHRCHKSRLMHTCAASPRRRKSLRVENTEWKFSVIEPNMRGHFTSY